MKKIYSLLLLITVILNADLSLEQIESMVNKIHEKREGVKLETLETTKEPFVRLEEDENNITTFVIPRKEEKIEDNDVKMILHAIVNGKAYINDKWLKPEEIILGYTLKHIGIRGVVLRNETNVKKLYLSKKIKSLITTEER